MNKLVDNCANLQPEGDKKMIDGLKNNVGNKAEEPVNFINDAIASYYDNDFDACRESLIKFFDLGHPKDVLGRDFLDRNQVLDVEIGLWAMILNDTGLLGNATNEALKKFIDDIYIRLVEVADPKTRAEAQQRIMELFPDLKPVGYADDGRPCYGIEGAAKALGLTEEEVYESLYNNPNRDQYLISSDRVHMIN